MKNIFIGITFLLLTACVTAGSPFAPPVRTVNDNVFYSDKNPKILVEVDPALQYGGKFTKSYSQSWGDHASNVTETVYVFTSADSRHKIDKGFAVNFRKIAEGYWKSTCYGKNMRVVNLEGDKYCKGEMVLTGQQTFGGFIDFVYANNYEIHPYYFVRNLTLRKHQDQISFHLIYFQKISKDLYYKFKTYFEGHNPISKDLMAYLKKFDDRCEGCFDIAKY